MSETLLILNPAAAGGKTKRLWPSLQEKLKKRIGDFDSYVSEFPGDITEKVRNEESYERIILCGGDGTLHEAVNGLFSRKTDGKKTTLGILSIGTGGDFIKSLNIPSSLQKQMEILKQNKSRLVDVGEVEYLARPGSKEYFINVVDVGLGADVLRLLEKNRLRFGRKMAYLTASLQGYLRRKPSRFRVVADGKEIWNEKTLIVAVANGHSFGGGMKIAPEAKVSDGFFDIVFVKDLKPLWLPIVLPLLYTGQARRLPHVQMFRAKEIEISSEESYQLEIDGELGGTVPVRFSLLPQALEIIA